MTTIDSWQMVYDKAGELIGSLLQEQPSSEFDKIDFENLIDSKAKEIVWGVIEPKNDWSIIIRPVKGREKLNHKIEEHFHIALRQGVYVRMVYEEAILKIKKYYTESSQPGELFKYGTEMISAFSCAQQHATAWRLLTEVRDKSYETRSEKANQVKSEKKEEEELLLRSLVESSIDRLRPNGGWRSHVIAGQDIAKDLLKIIDSYSFPITSNEDELSDKIQLLIWREPRLRKAYNEAAKNPLDEPVKMREVTVTISAGDEE